MVRSKLTGEQVYRGRKSLRLRPFLQQAFNVLFGVIRQDCLDFSFNEGIDELFDGRDIRAKVNGGYQRFKRVA